MTTCPHCGCSALHFQDEKSCIHKDYPKWYCAARDKSPSDGWTVVWPDFLAAVREARKLIKREADLYRRQSEEYVYPEPARATLLTELADTYDALAARLDPNKR
jgi:hypothetical protein